MSSKGKINLLPKDDFETSTMGKFVQWAVSVGRWIVVLTEFVVICAFLSRFYFDTKLANIFDEMKQKQAIVDSATSFEDNFRSVQGKITIIKTLLAQEEKPSDLVSDISKLLPLDVSLTKMVFGPNHLTLGGYSLTERGLSVFLSGLVSHPRLQEVTLSNVASQKDNSPGLTFSISASVKK